jgi:hypothetical protein
MAFLLGLLILVLDVLAILKIAQGKGRTVKKLLWILIILFLPVLGLLFWYLLGRD